MTAAEAIRAWHDELAALAALAKQLATLAEEMVGRAHACREAGERAKGALGGEVPPDPAVLKLAGSVARLGMEVAESLARAQLTLTRI